MKCYLSRLHDALLSEQLKRREETDTENSQYGMTIRLKFLMAVGTLEGD